MSHPPDLVITRPTDAGRGPMLRAAGLVTAVFVMSNSPTPLYGHWQRQLGFSSGTLTLIFAGYIVGLLLTLSVAGQLADRFGRRPVLVPGLLAAMVAAALFLTAASVAALLVARLLTGIAVGVIVSAGMATVVDQAGPSRRRSAARTASVAMVLGAGLGPLLAGSAGQWLHHSVTVVFTGELALLGGALVMLARLPSAPRHRDDGTRTGRWRLHLPSVPIANQDQVACGVAVFAPGITATSFVLSLGPSLLSRLLHVTSPLVAGGTAALMFLSATGVQFLVVHLRVRTILLAGAAATIAAMALLVLAVQTGNAPALIGAAVLSGSGQGLGQLGGLTLIGHHVADDRRAEANAVFNFGAYVPAGALPVATGYLIDAIGIRPAATLFAITLALAAAFGGMLVRIQLSARE